MLRSVLIAFDHGFAVLVLKISHEVVVREFLLFLIESVDDDTDEEIQDEERAYNHEEHAEEDEARVLISAWHLMNLRGVDRVPHDIHPTFRRHHTKHRHHGIHYVVKVSALVDPFAAIVKTIPLCQDLILEEVRHIRHITVEELAFEQAHSLDAEDQQDEDRNDEQICDAWNRIHQRDDLNLEPQIALQEPQWTQDSKHSEDFEDAEIAGASRTGQHEREEGEEYNDQIHDVPGIPRIACLSIAVEAEQDDIDQAL